LTRSGLRCTLAFVKTTENQPKGLQETTFRLFLQSELLRRCEKNPAYSVRAFARALGCDISTLSKILSGKRTVGRLAIERMGARLGLGPTQIQQFAHQSPSRENVVQTPTRRKRMGTGAEVDPNYQQLTIDSFKIISDWYHFAILELVHIEHFKPDTKWIAKTLGLRVAEVSAATERLIRIGFLKIDENGQWTDLSGGKTTTIGNRFTHSALKNLQKRILEKAIDALEDTPFELRDQSAITIAMNSSRMPEAKEKIKAFRRELAGFVRQGPLDSVYQISVSLYPLTQTTTTPKRKDPTK
jgi:uncharacterized protein (TIGR02147 family)